MATENYKSREYVTDALEENLIERGVALKRENDRLEREKVSVAMSQGAYKDDGAFDEANPAVKAIQDRIDSNNKALESLAKEWETKTGSRTKRYLRKVDNAYYDEEFPDEEPYSAFDKKADAEGEEAEAAPQGVLKRGKQEVVAQTQVNISDVKGQVELYKGDLIGLSHAVNQLLAVGLTPVDLVSTDPVHRDAAIQAVFDSNPVLAHYLVQELNAPASPRQEALMASLEDMRVVLEKAFDEQRSSAKAKEMIEQATVEGALSSKLGAAANALKNDPKAMIAFIGALVGLGYFYSTRSDATKGTVKNVLGWGLGLGGGLYLSDFLWKKMDDRHRGLFDRLGMSPGEIMTPEQVDGVLNRMKAAGFPEADQQSALDMTRMFEMPMAGVNEAMEQSLRSGKREIDTRTLQKMGLDGASAKRIDGVSVRKDLDYLYGTLAYDAAAREPGGPVARNPQDRIRIGLDYVARMSAENPDLKLRNVVWILGPQSDLRAAAQETRGSSVSTARESTSGSASSRLDLAPSIPQASLVDLMGEHPFLQGHVHALPSGVILVEGFPYDYFFADGRHRFKQRVTPSNASAREILIDESQDVKVQLDAFLKTSNKEARDELALEYSIDLSTENLSYNEGGYWERTPPDKCTALAGLPGKNSDTLPVVLAFGDRPTASIQFMPPITGAKAYYESYDAARTDYDRLVRLPALVDLNAGHLLLGMSYTIVDKPVDKPAASSSAGTTEVTLVFNDGTQGTVTFSKDVMDAIVLPVASAELQAKQKAKAQADVEGFTARPGVQKQLEKIATDFAAKPDSVWGTMQNALSDLTSYFSHLTDSHSEDRYNDAFVLKVRQFQVAVRDHLVTDVYKNGLNKIDYDAEMEQVGQQYEDALRGLVDGMLNQPVDAVATAAMKALHLDAVDVVLSAEDLTAEKDAANAGLEAAWKHAYEIHVYTMDATKRAALDVKIREEMAAMANDLNGKTKKSEVREVYAKYLKHATDEIGKNYALDSKAAVEKMVQERLTGQHKTVWEQPTQVVMNYVLYKLKWESYGVLPKPENAMKIMDLWFEAIKSGGVAFNTASSGKSEEMTYAEQAFLPQIDAFFGGHQDYSPDRLYAEVYSVSDDAFSTQLAALRANFMDAEKWKNGGAQKLPRPEALRGAEELYAERAKAAFVKWFDETLAMDELGTIDGSWPEVFRNHIIETRLPQVLAGAPDPTGLKKNLVRLAGFAAVERSVYVQLREASRVERDGGQELYQNVLNPAWDKVWKDGNLTPLDYSNEVQKNLGESGIIDTGWWTIVLPDIIGKAIGDVENLIVDF